jgi:hypothetical protein
MSLNPRRHPFRGGAEHYDIPWISKIPIRLNSLNRDCFDSTDGLSLGSTLNLPDSGMRGSTYAAIGVAQFDITLGLSYRPVWSLNVDCHDQIHRHVHPANQRCSFNHLRPDCVFGSDIYDATSDAPLKTEWPNGFRCRLRPKFNCRPIRVFTCLVWNAQFDLRRGSCAFTANSIGIARYPIPAENRLDRSCYRVQQEYQSSFAAFIPPEPDQNKRSEIHDARRAGFR